LGSESAVRELRIYKWTRETNTLVAGWMSSDLYKLTEVEGRCERNSREASLSFIKEVEQRIASVYIYAHQQ